ncbi:MAG: flagellar M-ring protein FliF [Deltaproteobacteria bacterium]|nr:MAG: flagellar M-ring protein FliF [Deltaproteobacteria bacterium]
MQQVLAVWSGFDFRKKVIVAGATLAMFLTILAIAAVASRPSMALLYSGLEESASGEVVTALEARGVQTEIRGGAIYVEASKRDELRMLLAAEGLPRNSAKGYELLDGISGFGTTSQMFDAAYWRAKEGELARTIVSSPVIESARVHIAVPRSHGLRGRGAASGSVVVIPASGGLSAANAKALKYLVASAVPGLDPSNVSVINGENGSIIGGDESTPADGRDLAETLKQNVERLLAARVGYGNAVVEVSVETVTDTETIRERNIDPQNRVAISTDTTETSAAASGSSGGAVTVASNLPSGDTSAGGGGSSSKNTETRELVNYEVSEVTREINRAPGAIRRLTVAVLVDGIRGTDDNGNPTWTPRSEEELAALHDLVASAVGFDEARGDQLTIKSLQFEPLDDAGTQASAGLLDAVMAEAGTLLKIGLLAATALAIGVFVIRPALSQAGNAALALEGDSGTADVDPGVAMAADLPSFEDENPVQDFQPMTDLAMFDPGNAFDGNSDDEDETVDPVERLRALIAERQAETVEILRGWMQDDEEEPA